MHNLNLAFVVVELLCNQLTFVPSQFPVIVLYGVLYVLWAWRNLFVHGTVAYPFVDPTHPKTNVMHLSLISALAIFFGLGCAIAASANLLPFGPRLLLAGTGSIALMRTPWIRGWPEVTAPAKAGATTAKGSK